MDINLEKDVLDKIPAAAAAAVRALVEHPRNALAFSAGQHGFHTVDPQSGKTAVLRGLTRVLGTLFWSEGDGLGAAASAMKRFARRRARASVPKWDRALQARPAAPPRTPGPHGAVRGTLVHAQIHDLVSLDKHSFRRRNGGRAHPWTHYLMKELLKRGRLPIAAEFIVWDDAMRIGTAIDLVAVDEATGTIEFYEVKTGYGRGEWTRSSGRMRGLLSAMDDTPLNRALIQVLSGTLLAVRGHRIYARIACWVAHVDDEGVEFIQLDPPFVDRVGPQLFNELLLHGH